MGGVAIPELCQAEMPQCCRRGYDVVLMAEYGAAPALGLELSEDAVSPFQRTACRNEAGRVFHACRIQGRTACSFLHNVELFCRRISIL